MENLNRNNIVWREDSLPPKTLKAFRSLAGETWLKRGKWYLAGGTALALQAGHRSSVDLDFFTPRSDFTPQGITGHFAGDTWITDIVREGTLYGRLHGAKASFIAYPFFAPRRPYKLFGRIPVLDLYDIAVMKVVAISQRGRKRDFVYLFWLCKNQEPLIDIMRRLPDQYPNVAHDYHHIIKSLTYFNDADSDPMPKLFFQTNWNNIKKFFRTEAKALAKEILLS